MADVEMRRQSVVAWTVLHTFKYSGRASRSEYWSWILVALGVQAGALVIGSAIGGGNPDATVGFMALITLLIIPTTVAVLVRRLHDVGQAGWWALMAPLPILGFILLVWLVLAGDRAANKFGDVPTYMVVTKGSRAALSESEPTRPEIPIEGVQIAGLIGEPEATSGVEFAGNRTPHEASSRLGKSVIIGVLGALLGVVLGGGLVAFLTRHSEGASTSYATAFDMRERLLQRGIGCEAGDTYRDKDFSYIECKTTDGGAFALVTYAKGMLDYGCVYAGIDPYVLGDGWHVEPVAVEGNTTLAQYPAMAPPEAIQDALGGEIISKKDLCTRLGG